MRSPRPVMATAAAWALAFGVLEAPAAAAPPPPRIVLVNADDQGRLLKEASIRLRAELTAAGFEAVDETSTLADPREAVESADGDAAATVTLREVRGGRAVDVWVYDRLTGKTAVRRIELGAYPKTPPSRALALRAVELLRANLLEAASPPPPSMAPPEASPLPPPPPRVLVWVQETSPPPTAPPTAPLLTRGGLEAGVGMLHSFGGLGTAPLPQVRLWAPVTRHLSGRLTLAGPGSSDGAGTTAGSARLRQELSKLEAVYAIATGWPAVVPLLSVGAGVYHVDGQGVPQAGYVAAHDDAWAALFDVGAGVAVRIASHASLVLDAHGVVLGPRPVISEAGVSAADAGRPSLLAALGLLVAL